MLGIAALLLGVVAAVLPEAAHAAPRHRGSEGPFETADTSWEGTSQLVALAIERLGRERVQITATLDYSELTDTDGVLVLHPEVDLSFDDVSRFLRAGGRLALADDHGKGDGLLRRFGITRIAAPTRPRHSLRGDPNLAIATPTVQLVAGVEQGRHPIVQDVDEVITNHPTALAHPELTPVLEIEAADTPPLSLAVTGIIANRGRMLAIGDPSIFINLMLRYPGNRKFAEGVIDYLVADDDWGPREGRLFIVTNDFRQAGRYGGGEGWLDDLTHRFHALQQEFDEWRDQGLPAPVAWGLAYLSALAVAAWLLTHAVRTYRPTLPRFARPVPAVARGGVAGRAAVLAAASTNPALPLLELKVALYEALARHLRPATPVPLEELCRAAVDEGLLSPADSQDLRKVATRLQQVEQSVVRGAPLRVRESEFLRLHQRVLELIRRLGDVQEPAAPPFPAPRRPAPIAAQQDPPS